VRDVDGEHDGAARAGLLEQRADHAEHGLVGAMTRRARRSRGRRRASGSPTGRCSRRRCGARRWARATSIADRVAQLVAVRDGCEHLAERLAVAAIGRRGDAEDERASRSARGSRGSCAPARGGLVDDDVEGVGIERGEPLALQRLHARDDDGREARAALGLFDRAHTPTSASLSPRLLEQLGTMREHEHAATARDATRARARRTRRSCRCPVGSTSSVRLMPRSHCDSTPAIAPSW
jgi:hypothetical protein